jgi:hypothetical protein
MESCCKLVSDNNFHHNTSPPQLSAGFRGRR